MITRTRLISGSLPPARRLTKPGPRKMCAMQTPGATHTTATETPVQSLRAAVPESASRDPIPRRLVDLQISPDGNCRLQIQPGGCADRTDPRAIASSSRSFFTVSCHRDFFSSTVPPPSLGRKAVARAAVAVQVVAVIAHLAPVENAVATARNGAVGSTQTGRGVRLDVDGDGQIQVDDRS